MATRSGGLVPRTGAWTGVFVGTDLISREVTLALNRRGVRLSGTLSLVIDERGRRGTATVTGTHVGGKIVLTARVPRGAETGAAEMKITGRLIATSGNGQAIVATTSSSRRLTRDTAFQVPLNGALCLTSAGAPAAVTLGEGDGGWVEENPEQ